MYEKYSSGFMALHIYLVRGSLEGESARVASASLILARDEPLPDDTLQVISTHPVPPHRLDGMIHFHVPDK